MKNNRKKTIEYLDELTRSIHGWTTLKELELLYRMASLVKKDGVIVEIGSWQGRSTVCLAKGAEGGSGAKIYAIDPFTGSSENQSPGVDVWTFDDFKQNLVKAGVENLVITLVATSEKVAKEWNKPIDLLFIDGAHEYEFVKKDFLFFAPHIKEGGVIAFHDTAPNIKAILKGWPMFGLPGPKKVVKENIFGSRNFKNVGLFGSIIYATKCNDNSWIDRLQNRTAQLKMSFVYLVYGFYLKSRRLPRPIKIFLKRILAK